MTHGTLHNKLWMDNLVMLVSLMGIPLYLVGFGWFVIGIAFHSSVLSLLTAIFGGTYLMLVSLYLIAGLPTDWRNYCERKKYPSSM